mgnify:CR=1 FL=1
MSVSEDKIEEGENPLLFVDKSLLTEAEACRNLCTTGGVYEIIDFYRINGKGERKMPLYTDMIMDNF